MYRQILIALLATILATASLPALEELPPHPRLYLTAEGGPRVPGLDELRHKVRRPELSEAWRRAHESGNPADRALVYLIEGDTTGLAVVREALDRTVSGYNQLVPRCLAFDWAYSALSETERRHFAGRLLESARAVGERYRIPTVYHNMCRGRHMAQGMTVLAALEDIPEARELIPRVEREMTELVEMLGDGYRMDDMDGRAGYGGGWPEGYDYDRHGSLYALQILLAWRSAGQRDYIGGRNYWRDKVLWLTYGTGPDGSFILGYEDNDWPFPMPHDRKMMTFLEGELQSGLASWWIETFTDSLDIDPYWEILFSNPDVRSEPPDDLPTGRLIPGLGLALMRSGWESDATFVHFHCGPWYTYHQHVAQGSFSAWRDRWLVVEPGVYDGNVDEHYVNWRIRSISHNCVLVTDPEERFLGPGDVPRPANDGGQVIQEWTLKPANVAEWRAQKAMRNTGRIERFSSDASHDYVRGEAGNAYSPHKLAGWKRQMVFIKPSWLVIRDDVQTTSHGRFNETLVLHTPGELSLEGRRAAAPGVTFYSLLPEGETGLTVKGGPGRMASYGGNHWKGPDAYNTQIDDAWRLEVENSGGESTFLTAIHLGGNNGASVPAPVAGRTGGDGPVSLSLEDGRWEVSLGEPGTGGGYSLAGEGITYSISGSVSEGGFPVRKAGIALGGASEARTETDHWGRYLFEGLGPGEYTLELDGGRKSLEVRITDYSRTDLDFQ